MGRDLNAADSLPDRCLDYCSEISQAKTLKHLSTFPQSIN